MALLAILAELVVIVTFLVTLTAFSVVGTDRLTDGAANWRTRVRGMWRHFAALGVVLVLNKVARDYGPTFSWILNWNVTGLIYSIEGNTVAVIQSISTPALTAVLGASYVYGYTFLLVFPFVAYFVVDEQWPLERTIVAYGVNYVIGVACYTAFVSYGPRNLLPDMVTPLLYTEYPLSKLLTTRVNANTNVFPSLHASLAVTVALLSVQTRDVYPRWPLVAVPVATAVTFSTMYLGIHWAVDVVAGAALGAGSVAVAKRVTGPDVPQSAA